ncbi:hypothetical protein K437DRAFT_82045 [Tilletiaria anomala UBC 951]|uniref:Secreted protein n=1 Tax=Tilletiaria anomala (strain ATCC 24038 / CBS 436.72 / UBC 951) TaxID=1037660 RepID=A0A066V4M5_TILAU|nr:uncharacterized protein K437DRAFT_82045 [Tilletiaria anomala UBC 951]KDN35193.1 hypothetical protein K437DRAFT_82045 [Tilletiaria anomala UBC 951]
MLIRWRDLHQNLFPLLSLITSLSSLINTLSAQAIPSEHIARIAHAQGKSQYEEREKRNKGNVRCITVTRHRSFVEDAGSSLGDRSSFASMGASTRAAFIGPAS